MIRPVREISAEEERFRVERWISLPGVDANVIRRDPVEPEAVGTYVVMVFQITGYDPDCDGSLMARLRCVDKDGCPTGWETSHIGLYPDVDLVIDRPSELWELVPEKSDG